MDPSGILLKTSIFGDLSVPDVDELRADLSLRTFGRGQSVWFEGDRADALVVLAQGQLKAHRISLDGRELIVQLLTAVGVTGEVGLFHPAGVRWFGLTAMTTADCFMIRRAPLLAFLARHPAAMQRMLEQLSLTAMTAANSFSQTAFEDISHRVASLLLSLADQHGHDTADGLRLAPSLSQAELAAQVGASRENVNRALAPLVSSGVISQRSGHFYVQDRAALEAAARDTSGHL